jgi:drug/metabolite transporter (DMT)-like permease
MAVYYAALAGAYRAGDMSVAYPLARSVPVLLVALVTFALGRRTQVGMGCVTGIVLVVTGCFLLPMQRFSQIHVRHYLNATCALALIAAFGTAGYSLVDDEALRRLRGAAADGWGVPAITLLYLCLDGAITSLWLLLFILPRREGRLNLKETVRAHLPHAAAAGAVIYAAYALVLVSMAHVSNISYVVAFRQLSIPLGATFGILVLREPPHGPKLVGVLIMFAGLVLVAVG